MISKKKINGRKKKIIQSAGAFPFKRNTGSFTIMAFLSTGDTLNRTNERRVNIGLKPKTNDLHITLYSFYVDLNTAYASMLMDPRIYDAIDKCYSMIYRKNPLIFKSQELRHGKVVGGNWDILGGMFGKTSKEKFNSKYFARVYNVFDAKACKIFRQYIWEIIHDMVGKTKKLTSDTVKRGVPGDMETFKIYSFNKEELYALNNFYSNIKDWKPHISILRFGELEQVNNKLWKDLYHADPDQKKQIKILKDAMAKGGSVYPISNIQSDVDLKDLKIGINFKNKPTLYPKGKGFREWCTPSHCCGCR